jgi:hypothetical protein
LVGKSTDAAAELAKADAELRTALTDLERVLALGVGPVRLGEDGELIIPPLTAEDISAEAEVLKAELTELLPFAPIVSLLIELDRRTGFLDCFTHAGGKQARTPELAPLGREFSQEQEVQSLADVVRWRDRQRLVAPAEDALRDVLRRPYRDDPEATVARLAGVAMDGLPDDLARRVFGLWSNACARLVDQRGWHEPYRYVPATSRGVVFARPMHHGPYEVVSALGSPDWQPGQRVAGSLPRGARELAIR